MNVGPAYLITGEAAMKAAIQSFASELDDGDIDDLFRLYPATDFELRVQWYNLSREPRGSLRPSTLLPTITNFARLNLYLLFDRFRLRNDKAVPQDKHGVLGCKIICAQSKLAHTALEERWYAIRKRPAWV